MMKMPEPSELGWTCKPLESANVTSRTLSTGVLEVVIEHELIKGVTPAMLYWWFQNFPSLMINLNGQIIPAYVLWHPRDHVAVELEKLSDKHTLSAGDILTVHDKFQAGSTFAIDQKAHISRLDENGIGLKTTVMGLNFLELTHSYKLSAGGTLCRSHLTIGAMTGPLKSMLNRAMAPKKFEGDKAVAWLKHNIEEIGFFENFLPQLYENRSKKEPIELRL
ncbi:hypothetical protein E1162_03810 [Rhodobacteraceae bacterium RKSG542]|uniref:DAPG hydrolase family protein n=1 Tax=Pseudovibrio flavus TaxID=2529854 RepID=UPI0012BC0BF3|nr:hypothetical protein [Pseudovibrio flavus]MTI16364.1 hypothetical protein [Pseudovibrio flavus]